MREKLISLETAKLAKERGLVIENDYFYCLYGLKKHKVKKSDISFLENPNEFVLYEGTWENHCIKPVPCYEPYYSAPSQSLLQKWLRETHNIHVQSVFSAYFNRKFRFDLTWFNCDGSVENQMSVTYYDSYEEALEVGLQEGLKLIKVI